MIEILNTYDKNIKEENLKSISQLPKNVRQMGEVSSNNKKIFIEDYVYTYLYQYASLDLDNSQIAILLGNYYKYNDEKILLISGAVQAKYFLNHQSGIILTSETWTYIYDKVKEYFDNLEILGWMFSHPGYSIGINDQIGKVHTDNFPGSDKVLFVIDPIEKDDAFYLYENQKLRQQNGYYVYYERNEKMHQYMLNYRISKEKSEPEPEEEVIVNYRRQVRNRRQEVYHKKLVNMLYAVSGALAIIVLVIGVALMDNYDKMKDLEATINNLSINGPNIDKEGSNKEPEDANENNKDNEDKESKDEDSNNKEENSPVGSNNPAIESANNTTQSNSTQNNPTQINNTQTNNTPANSAQNETTATVNPVDTYHTYIVKEGDTLAYICFQHYSNVDMMREVMAFNNISNPNLIYVGQNIKLPQPKRTLN
ncbi:LysM peptidoglycan-binding domain-containing protein [Natranaerovirga pectinivora]|nr:LysM peptidoglycan-binding domain-containing protein [Natranaerovirga pectinivora]